MKQGSERPLEQLTIKEMGRGERQAKELYQLAEEGYGANFTWSKQQFRESLYSPFSTYLGLFKNSRCIGFICLHEVAGEVEIHHLVLLPEEKRKGYGEFLLKETLGYVFGKGANSVFLEVRRSNVAARSLYRKIGFKEVGIRKNYYDSPIEDAFVMKLEKKGAESNQHD